MKYGTEFSDDVWNPATSWGKILQQIQPNSCVLECGSAQGHMTRCMRDRLSCQVYIVEYDPEAYALARQYAVDGVCGDLMQDDWLQAFRNVRFDYILFADVLEHLADPAAVLKKSLRLLKDGGEVLSSIPNIAHNDVLVNLFRDDWRYTELGLLDASHIRFWAKDNLEPFFRGAGLQIARLDYCFVPMQRTEQFVPQASPLPKPVLAALQQRVCGEVYQFIVTAVRAPGCPAKPDMPEDPPSGAEEAVTYTEADAKTLAAQLEKAGLERDKLQADLMDCRSRLIAAQTAYDTIANAFFWKLTKPMRRMTDKLKVLLRNNRAAHALWNGLKRAKDRLQPIRAQKPRAASAVDLSVCPRIDVITTQHTYFVALLIQQQLQRANRQCKIHIGRPATYAAMPYIVLCPQFLDALPPAYIAFQMEQTISTRWLNERYDRILRDALFVFDYSLENIGYFTKHGFDVSRLYYLPIDYAPGLPTATVPAEYDVLFYGDTDCPRRKRILAALGRRFSVKIIRGIFLESLYSELQKAKVVVNIHFYEGALLETTRIYETLSRSACIIVSERSTDAEEDRKLEGIVDFVDAGDVHAITERVAYWLEDEERRKRRVAANRAVLESRCNEFAFFFQRFLLAQDVLTFDDFCSDAGSRYVLPSNKICLSLAETPERRASFLESDPCGFALFPGLRHKRAWTGCGLSYRFLAQKALEQAFEQLTVCEDDVDFPSDFPARLQAVTQYLADRPGWDAFSGLIADVRDNVQLWNAEERYGERFLSIDRMVSMVFNIYSRDMLARFHGWNPRDGDPQRNTVDRYLEQFRLHIVTTVPFLVGHREALNSTLWGQSNHIYTKLIQSSGDTLRALAAQKLPEQSPAGDDAP